MPVVFKDRGFRFFFFSFEGSPREPIHVHVKRTMSEAKFWVGDEVELAYNHGLTGRELALAALAVRARRREIQEAWHGHFG